MSFQQRDKMLMTTINKLKRGLEKLWDNVRSLFESRQQHSWHSSHIFKSYSHIHSNLTASILSSSLATGVCTEDNPGSGGGKTTVGQKTEEAGDEVRTELDTFLPQSALQTPDTAAAFAFKKRLMCSATGGEAINNL